MRDEYIGDIGDFGKYILLNELRQIAGDQVQIGVNWYYNTCPAPAFRYLFDDNRNEFSDMNGALFTRLETIYKNRKPRLLEVENGNVIPRFQFFSDPIPCPKILNHREAERDQWFEKSLKDLEAVDIVFLDPDNGIAPSSVTKRHMTAVKYIFIDEIMRYYDEKNKSVIIYQHQNREKKDDGGCLKKFTNEIQKINPCYELILLQCPKCTVRYYALIAKTSVPHGVFARLSNKLTSRYPGLFEPVL